MSYKSKGTDSPSLDGVVLVGQYETARDQGLFNANKRIKTMRKTIFGCLGAAAVAFALQFTTANAQASLFGLGACDPCGEAICDPCGDVDGCGPSLGKWFINGHMEAGFFANAHGAKNTIEEGIRFPGNNPMMEYDIAGPNNTRLTGGQINQIYVSAGRSVDGKRGLDFGGTVDFTWGSDAFWAQSVGLEANAGNDYRGWGGGDYYAAFAQAYTEVEYGRLNVKVGKFYAPFGIDSYKSTENFFYSWNPAMNIIPTTLGGFNATYKVNNNLSVFGGWAVPTIGETSKDNAFLGGFDWSRNRLNVHYAYLIGKDSSIATKYFFNSLTTTYQVSKRVKYVFDWSLANYNFEGAGNLSEYSLMNEVIYTHNKKWAYGLRFGMTSDNFYDADFNTVSLGANWTPNKWLLVKPEIRYDWNNDGEVMFGKAADKTYQFSGGMSAVVKF